MPNFIAHRQSKELNYLSLTSSIGLRKHGDGGLDECPGQYSRNLISLLHLYFSYINGTELTNQLLGRLNMVSFRN